MYALRNAVRFVGATSHSKLRQYPPRRHHSYDPDGKTTVQFLNKNVDGLMIDSYSQVGFRLNNGLFVLGPMVIFPRTVLSWNVSTEDDITEDSLSLFWLLEPKIDILVVGIGSHTATPTMNRKLLQFITRHRMNIEVLSTDQACATFNFLNAEGRYVAGALIPPANIEPTASDVFETRKRRRKLFSSGKEDDD